MDHELDHFKRSIHFVSFAKSKGYQIEQRASSVSCLVLHDAQDDKLIVGRTREGVWLYRSAGNPDDAGSIIEFLQKREPKPLAEIRAELRRWTHEAHESAIANSHEAFPITEQQAAIALAIARAHEPPSHPYLESRGLIRETLSGPRFHGAWKQDAGDLRTVLFPHHDFEGLCGFEWRNVQLHGFSEGASKGLWQSQCTTSDTTLVITESPVDAFSHHQLHPDEHTRYIALSIDSAEAQPRLISMAIAFMQSRAATIVAATSNHRTGHELAESLRCLAQDYGLNYRRCLPTRGRDWSADLQGLSRQSSIRLRLARGLDT